MRVDFESAYPPEAAAREARLRPDDPLAALVARYRAAVALWEAWFLEEPRRVWLWESDLRWVTHDLTACANCDGSACRTVMAESLARRSGEPVAAGSPKAAYYSVVPGPYGPPYWAFYPCRDPAARRQRVLMVYQRLVERARRLLQQVREVAG